MLRRKAFNLLEECKWYCENNKTSRKPPFICRFILCRSKNPESRWNPMQPPWNPWNQGVTSQDVMEPDMQTLRKGLKLVTNGLALVSDCLCQAIFHAFNGLNQYLLARTVRRSCSWQLLHSLNSSGGRSFPVHRGYASFGDKFKNCRIQEVVAPVRRITLIKFENR